MSKRSSILRQVVRFYSISIYSLFEAKFLNGFGGVSLHQFSSNSIEYMIRLKGGFEDIDYPI